MEKIFILNIYIVYLICSTHCVNSPICKINKFNFIGYKLNHTNGFGTNIYRKNASSSLPSGDSNSTGPIDVVKYTNPDFNGSSADRLFDVNNRHTPTLKLPIKCVLDSLIPELFRVLEARKELGCASIPSLLCCSGGVDSMSLLHSFGLIKENYECLVNDHIQLNFSSYPINTGGARPDKRSRRKMMMELFDEFYKNFNVIYFNHKQREDVERDIEVIRRACEEYKFNLIVEELPTSIQEEGKDTGLQNIFRAWRRETCVKIINHLSSINIRGSADRKGSSSSGNDRTVPSSIRNKELELKGPFEPELESVRKLGDIVDLKGLIFMGHNLDDNFETLLLKILRGSFVSNLTPMELYDNLDHREYMLVRPFINIKKANLISFIQSLKETYNEDSSNSKLYYTRNLMRNVIIPEVLSNMSGTIAANSTGNEDVGRGKVESRPLLLGLHTKLKYLSRQCHNISSLLEHEVDMYYDYINSKYRVGVNGSGGDSGTNDSDDAPSKSAGDAAKESWKEAYRQFYASLFRSCYNGRTNKLETVFENNLNYLRRMGLRFEGLFNLKEWNVVPNRMVKEQVLYRYIVEKTGGNVLYRVLYKLVNHLSKEPFSESLKMYSVGSHLMYHQGYYLKLGPNASRVKNAAEATATTTESGQRSSKDAKLNQYSGSVKEAEDADRKSCNSRKLIFSDENVAIYNCIDKLNMAIANPRGRYHVNLRLEPARASSSKGIFDIHYSSGNNVLHEVSHENSGVDVDDPGSGGDRRRLELEIRYLREDDVSTSRKLWSNSVYRILGNIGLHRFLKDEVPALVVAGTNDVIGLYGYNLSPPYRNRDSQTILYQADGIKRPRQYQLTIL